VFEAGQAGCVSLGFGAPITANHLSYNFPPRAIEETSSAAKLIGEKLIIETATKKLTRFVILIGVNPLVFGEVQIVFMQPVDIHITVVKFL